MKKNLLMVFFLIFIFSFNIIVDAKEVDYIFKYNQGGSHDLLEGICNAEASSCTFIASNDASITGKYSDVSFIIDNNGGIKEFYLDYFKLEKDLSGLKSKLQGSSCNGYSSCYQYVQEKYCNNWSNTEKVCNDLKGMVGTPGNVSNDGASGSCDVNLYLKGSSKVLKQRIDYNLNENYIAPYTDVTDTSIINDEGYVIGYNNRFYWYGKNSNFRDFTNEYLNKIKESGSCPTINFCYYSNVGNYYTWYAELGECDYSLYKRSSQIIDGEGNNSGIVSGTSNDADNDGSSIIGDRFEIDSCEKLLGGDTEAGAKLVSLLKTIITIVKILIPIILIGLSILDFSKSIFAGEDDMKKAQSRFIKRILIAVLIFLIPVLIKFILTIANLVWPNISVDLCGIL